MPPDGLTLPFSVSHRDPSGLFVIETTVVDWREAPGDAGEPARVTVTLGTGMLHDADKGAFPLDGLELTIRIGKDGIQPLEVLNPGVLSEFQQEALLDAMTSGLNALNRCWSSPSESELP